MEDNTQTTLSTMKTSAHSVISTTTALGLATFSIASAFTAGAAAPTTIVAFGLLAIYGLIEIAILSYTEPRVIGSVVRTTPRATAARRLVRVPALVEYPAVKRPDLAPAT